MVSKRHLSPFMYKTAKCSPGILAAETGQTALSDHRYLWLCVTVPSSVSVFNRFLLFFLMKLVSLIYEIINIGVCK